jgi:hypothetical protein
MSSFKTGDINDLDVKVEQMGLEELREFSRNLIRLVRVDNELIQSMRNMLDKIENQQGV